MATLEISYIIRIKVLYGRERYKCGKTGCKGWMNDDEFGFKLQREKCLKDVASKEVKEIDKLSWHQEFVGDLSPCRNKLLSELKAKAPPNGRAVTVFKAKCGCPYAKIEAWSSQHSARRHVIAS